MLKTFGRNLLVAAALAAATLGLAAAPASARETRLVVTATPEAGIVLAQYHDRYSPRDDRYDRDDHRGGPRYDHGDRRGGPRYERESSCAPGQALRKAGQFGLRRPEIVRDSRRAVVVDGWKRGRLVSVSFAQARGCPVLGIR